MRRGRSSRNPSADSTTLVVDGLRRLGARLGIIALLVPIMLPLLHAIAAADGIGGLDPRTMLCRADAPAPDGSSQPDQTSHLKLACPICQTLQALGGFVPPRHRLDAPDAIVIADAAPLRDADGGPVVRLFEQARPRAPPALT